MPANDPGNNKFDPYPFSRSQWKEMVAGLQPGGGDQFGLESSDVVLVGYIPWTVRFSFIRAVLGYSFVEPTYTNGVVTGGKMRRNLPLFHPWYEWMAAYQVHLQARTPQSELHNYGSGSQMYVKKINAPNPFLEFDFAAYGNANCLIRFRQQPWEWRVDSSAPEYTRYFYEMDSAGELQVFSQLKDKNIPMFVEGPFFNPSGNTYPGEVPFYAFREQLRMRWMYVPKDFVCTEGTFKKPKISSCVGRVNLYPFLGYNRGELLLNPPQYERFEWPLRTVDNSAYGYNIIFPFSVFTPPKGVTNVNVAGGVTGAFMTTAGTGYAPDGVYALGIAGGGGTGATGTFTVSGSKVTAVTITAPGTGYTTPPSLSFPGAGGTGAQGTAEINTTSPYFGHDLLPYAGDGKYYLVTRTPDGQGPSVNNPRIIPAVDFSTMFTHAATP